MAKMNPYTAYDDAGSTPGSMIADIATAPFKPSTHLWMYGHVPGMWSGTKGVYVPWSKEGMIRGAREIGKSFTDKKYPAGFGQALKMPLNLRPFGGGSRVGGGLLQEYRDVKKYIKGYKRKWGTQHANRMVELVDLGIAHGGKGPGIRVGAIRLGSTVRDDALYTSKQVVMRRLFGNAQGPVRGLATQEMAAKMVASDAPEHIQKIATKRGLQTTLTAGRAAKWTLRGAKVVAGIGAAMFAWDVAKMIGQPLGRAIVSEFEQVATSFNQRFMPELGGRLEMSYLSRGAATERQRAIDAMSRAQITGRSSFGQESKYVHQ